MENYNIDNETQATLDYWKWVEALQPLKPLEPEAYRPLIILPATGCHTLYLGPETRALHAARSWFCTFTLVEGKLREKSVRISSADYMRRCLSQKQMLPEVALHAVERDCEKARRLLVFLFNQTTPCSVELLLKVFKKVHGGTHEWSIVSAEQGGRQGVEDDYKDIDPTSWYLGSLRDVPREINRVLRTYIRPYPIPRCDLMVENEWLDVVAAHKNLPHSRWPSATIHSLSEGQRAALCVATKLSDVEGGLVSVSGPPGTGKTTVIKEVIADAIVQSSLEMLDDDLEFSFLRKVAVNGHDLSVRAVPRPLRGRGVVVASDNNAAVENIALEIPCLKSIGDEFKDIGYLKDIAQNVLGDEAWGLVAAVLGSRVRTRKFAAKLWFNEIAPGEPGLLSGWLWDKRPRAPTDLGAARRALGSVLRTLQQYRAGTDLTSERYRSLQSQLFIRALGLREAWIYQNREAIRTNLSLWVDLVLGRIGCPEPEVAEALWDTFFLVVPVVTTTFASAARLLKPIRSIDWLLIDEGGQVLPHHPVHLMNKCERCLLVGDVMQLAPICPLDEKTHEKLVKEFKIQASARVDQGSAQRMADAGAVFGARIGAGQGRWVGVPLRTHYRCDQPMYETSNVLCYDNQMRRFERPDHVSPYPASSWIHVPGQSAGRHYSQHQGDALIQLLHHMVELNDKVLPDAYVLTPFREIVAGLSREIIGDAWLNSQFTGAELKAWCERYVGTVHKAQGKESAAIVLVLGLDPLRPAAADWVGQYPNMLNVAVTRGKARLYVIGDRDLWCEYPNFRVMMRYIEEKAAGDDRLDECQELNFRCVNQ